jgi:hypothetical protein
MTMEEKQRMMSEALYYANIEFDDNLDGTEDVWDTFGYVCAKIIGDEETTALFEKFVEREWMFYDFTKTITLIWYDGKTYEILCWGTGGD